MIKNQNKILAEMVPEPNYDMIVSINIPKEHLEKLEKKIFEDGSVPYNGRDENGNLLTGDIVKIQKTKKELFLYINLGGDSSGKKGTII